MQVRASLLLLVACVSLTTSFVDSVSVVRVPRVYNVLIRSDGALAPSEAVSADSLNEEKSPEQDGDEEKDEEAEMEVKREELPILDPKMGAIQDGVNYTEVPLSRAYPLTRYTAPLLAPLSYITPLHGGLILGPVPRLAPLPESHQAETREYARELPRGAFDDPDRDSVAVEADDAGRQDA